MQVTIKVSNRKTFDGVSGKVRFRSLPVFLGGLASEVQKVFPGILIDSWVTTLSFDEIILEEPEISLEGKKLLEDEIQKILDAFRERFLKELQDRQAV